MQAVCAKLINLYYIWIINDVTSPCQLCNRSGSSLPSQERCKLRLLAQKHKEEWLNFRVANYARRGKLRDVVPEALLRPSCIANRMR